MNAEGRPLELVGKIQGHHSEHHQHQKQEGSKGSEKSDGSLCFIKIELPLRERSHRDVSLHFNLTGQPHCRRDLLFQQSPGD